MTHLPTTKQLRYFVALEQYEHFGKAAESCFVQRGDKRAGEYAEYPAR